MRTAAIIPAYNEAGRVGPVVVAATKFVDQVILVDDGSTDETAAIAKKAGALVVAHRKNCGAGAATMTGIEAARRMGYEIAITLDADGQHDSQDIPRLLEILHSKKADLVIANRFGQKNNIPFIRRLANGIGNFLTFAVTGLWLPDTQCGFKVFGPNALKQVQLKMPGFEFCTEIIREASQYRWKIVSVPSKVVYSEYTLAKGQSFANGLRTAAKILVRSFLR
ncbi:MAG: glycosyltransferase family 2 protein [Candidatus Peribacteraceae bacterium]|nr:glycosyltransferase family 2 protein [Candidatus Peribacteraceae bacterium]